MSVVVKTFLRTSAFFSVGGGFAYKLDETGPRYVVTVCNFEEQTVWIAGPLRAAEMNNVKFLEMISKKKCMTIRRFLILMDTHSETVTSSRNGVGMKNII